VVVNGRTEYEIWDARGEVIPYVTPAIPANRPNVPQIVEYLLHLSRYQTVLSLTPPPSHLERSVEITLLAGPAQWAEKTAIPIEQELTPLTRTADAFLVRNGEAVFLRIANRGAQAIHVAAIDLTCDWAIELLVPDPRTGAQAEIVGRGETRVFPIIMYFPSGFTTTRDVLKVFATTGNAPFAWLQQPALGQRPATRSTDRGTCAGVLAALFDALDAEINTTRAARPAISGDLAWVTSEFHLQVI
jgi:hypothetical protein